MEVNNENDLYNQTFKNSNVRRMHARGHCANIGPPSRTTQNALHRRLADERTAFYRFCRQDKRLGYEL